jgi:hypothetical protein
MAVPARPDDLDLRSGFDWLNTAVAVPADRRVLIWVGAVAIMTDIAVRAGGVGLAGALLVVMVVVAILASGRVAGLHATIVVAAAPLFGTWLFLRTSPWLLVPDLVVVAGLIGLGVSLGRGNLLDLTIPAAAARIIHVAAHGAAGPPYVVAAARTLGQARNERRRARIRGVVRGAMMAAPLLVVLGILLASADAVFASLFHIDADPPALLTHTLAIVLGAWVMAGLLRAASGSPIGRLPPGPRLGRTEALVVLGSMNVLFLAFAAAQLVALSQGGRKVIETAGLTYAEYARRGFFQLLAVAAITLATLLILQALADRRDPVLNRTFTMFAELTVALALVIVFVSVRRLGLYADVFGLTMLRLYCTIFAYWIGAVFILLGLFLAGAGRGRSWWPAAAVGVGLAGLLWLNLVNPEAVVVRHNVAFAARTGRFDPAYVSGLSDDAIPVVVGSLPNLDPAARRLVLVRLCPPRPIQRTGWAAYNVAREHAVESLRAACGSSA